MIFRRLFPTRESQRLPITDARNAEGAPAYLRSPQAALAQYAATGCLGGTFYATAAEQLDRSLALAREVAQEDPELCAKVALWARRRGHMKDLPALLVAFLLVDHGELAARIFDRVIDDGRMLRKFVQIVRSGAVGRRCFGTRPRRLIRQWLARRSDRELLFASIGEQPSLGDIVKLVHPKPESASRRALFGWLTGRDFVLDDAPLELRDFLAFLTAPGAELPDVPFLMLSGRPLCTEHWRALARRCTWQQLRMNLNSFLRHGVFDDADTLDLCVERLRDPAEIAATRTFPYQFMTALDNLDDGMPEAIRVALMEAIERATLNVPALDGRVLVAVDVSGSMQSPISGRRGSATSKVRCVDVAALFAATILRRNQAAQVLPFTSEVIPFSHDPEWTVAQLSTALAALPSGGTNCSAPLREWNRRRAGAELIVLISDNESWVDAGDGGRGTATLAEWRVFRARNRGSKLVCLDLQPSSTTQARNEDAVLNVGGFSDAVFDLIDGFARDGHRGATWLDRIRALSLDATSVP